jgi:hypothetical protein
MSKTRKPRVVGLDPRAISWLLPGAVTGPEGDDVNSLVFAISTRTVQRDIARLVDMPPYAMRRRFAVSWLQRGGSQTSLQTIYGWSSPVMVSRYAKSLASETALIEFRRLMGLLTERGKPVRPVRVWTEGLPHRRCRLVRTGAARAGTHRVGMSVRDGVGQRPRPSQSAGRSSTSRHRSPDPARNDQSRAQLRSGKFDQ